MDHDIPCILSESESESSHGLMDIHGISKDIPYICHVYVGDLHIHGIYQAYSRHIVPKIAGGHRDGVPSPDSDHGRINLQVRYQNSC